MTRREFLQKLKKGEILEAMIVFLIEKGLVEEFADFLKEFSRLLEAQE